MRYIHGLVAVEFLPARAGRRGRDGACDLLDELVALAVGDLAVQARHANAERLAHGNAVGEAQNVCGMEYLEGRERIQKVHGEPMLAHSTELKGNVLRVAVVRVQTH